MPSVYFKDSESKKRKNKKPYHYKGNFQDIQHICKPDLKAGQTAVDNNQVVFATQLRQYGSQRPETRKLEEDYDRNFQSERKSLLELKGLGSTFLPPINENSIARLQRVPVLRVDNRTKSLVGGAGSRSDNKIHSFDPSNLSLPRYSSKYAEKNAAVYSHLAGGHKDVISNNQANQKSSDLHWMLGLRHHGKVR